MRVPLLLSGLGLALNMLRRLMIRVIILLDNLLIFGNTLEQIQMAQESLIFLLQHLSFVINFKKRILKSTQEILSRCYYKFRNNDFVFTFTKGEKIKNQCLVVYKMQEITSLHLKKLLGTLTSSIQAIFSARLQFQYIQ